MIPQDEPTVFIVDDDPQVRKSTELNVSSVQIPAESFANAQDFLDSYDRRRAGCLVLDVSLPGMSGLELQQHMNAIGMTIPIIMITGYAEVPMAVQAVQAGAFAFLQKPCSRQELLDVIHRAINKDRKHRQTLAESADVRDRLTHLAPRESEVMELLVQGKTTKEIASALKISTKTVDFHRWNVLKKMDSDNVVDLTRTIVLYREARARG